MRDDAIDYTVKKRGGGGAEVRNEWDIL